MAHYNDYDPTEEARNKAAHEAFLDQVEAEIELIIGLSPAERQAANREYEELTGKDPVESYYNDRETYEEIEKKHRTGITLRNMSWREAHIFTEHIRIAHPDQNVSLYTRGEKGSWIGYTTWNDQMKMFFGYEVYTPYGEVLKREANEYAEAEGIPMAWE
jgi:hypothetical protein